MSTMGESEESLDVYEQTVVLYSGRLLKAILWLLFLFIIKMWDSEEYIYWKYDQLKHTYVRTNQKNPQGHLLKRGYGKLWLLNGQLL